MVIERGDCHTIQGMQKKPQWRGSLWACDCYKGTKVSLRMNTGCLKEKQPPRWNLRARLLLAQASKGAVEHMRKKLTSRARAVSVKMSGSLKVVCAFPLLPIWDPRLQMTKTQLKLA